MINIDLVPEAIQRYRNGASLKNAGKIAGVGAKTFRNILVANGVTIHAPHYERKKDYQLVAKVCTLRDSALSYVDIAKQLGISYGRVQYIASSN